MHTHKEAKQEDLDKTNHDTTTNHSHILVHHSQIIHPKE